MVENSSIARIDAAHAYEALFVPALFGQWAPGLADAAQLGPGQRVLDVGCGTGVLAREAAMRVAPAGHVVGIDPNPGMLAVARELAPDIEWCEGVAESLPFEDRSFDAALSQFALMFFADRPAGLREMYRVLEPGGRLVVAVWGSLETMPAYASEVALLDRMAGPDAADALRAPFVLGDRKQLAALFTASGVDAIEITTHGGRARFPGLRAMVEADLRGWLPVMGVHLDEELIGRMLQEAEVALASHATADGRAAFHLSAFFVSATKH